MKTLLFSVLFFGIAVIAHAQQPKTSSDRSIVGTIQDQSKKVLSYVTIDLTDSTKKSIATTITDDKGKFTLQSLPQGNLTISMGLVGFATRTMAITGTGKIDIGIVILEQDVKLLKEVAITAQGPTVSYQLDKKIFLPGRDVISQSGSATDLLSGVPL